MSDLDEGSRNSKRLLSDGDVELLGGSAVAATKVAVAGLALLNAAPMAAIGIVAASELLGVIAEREKWRVQTFLERFRGRAEKLSIESRSNLESNMSSDSGQQIIEITIRRAASSIDPHKLDYLASVAINGLSSTDFEGAQVRRLLELTEALDSADFILLQSRLPENKKAETWFYPDDQSAEANEARQQNERAIAFREKNASLFAFADKPKAPELPVEYRASILYGRGKPVPTEVMAKFEADKESYEVSREKHAIFENRMHRLVEMGLFGTSVRVSRDVDVDLTPLGMALLKITDLASSNQWATAEAVGVVGLTQRMLNQGEAFDASLKDRQEKQERKERRQALEAERELRNLASRLGI